MRRAIPALLVWVAAWSTGCNDNNLGIEKRAANRPPETSLTSGPPDSTDATAYKVHLFWSGTDPDGTIDHYDFIMVDHPPAKDNIRGDGPNPVIVEVPEVDDPRWRGSTATDSIFITLADTLRNPTQPSDSTGTAEEIRNMEWERWHTFFVRAVDNEGVPDPTPDYRSFNSVNIAPHVWLTEPFQPGFAFSGPPVIIFNWDGEDPVGNGDTIDPVASRWVLIDSQIDNFKKPLSFPDSLYVLPERYEWSPWARWDPDDLSTRRAIVSNLNYSRVLEDGSVVGYYVFAVQAMDEAGAITPVFDNATLRRNNAVAVQVSGAVGPLLTVNEQLMGTWQFLGTGFRTIELEVAVGQTLSFCWDGDASRYGGEVVDYRYGWNVINPEDDSEWDQTWCESCLCATPRAFTAGKHTLTIQARDNAETITEARFLLHVNQVTRAREVLWVDDTRPTSPTTNQEALEDQRWLQILGELASENSFSFDPVADVYDVYDARNEIPPIHRIFDYKSVIWSVRQEGALTNLARFIDPFLEKNRNAKKRFNFLRIYLLHKGNLWVVGDRPAKMLWIELTLEQNQHAVNITNWDDDPEEQHPLIDSVGTLSLLYSLGVEMFDCGSGTGCGPRTRPRSARDHLCQGVARNPTLTEDSNQAFTTTTHGQEEHAHSHTLKVVADDIDAGAAGEDILYEVLASDEHAHQVRVPAADLETLRDGRSVTLTTEPAAHDNHTHDVDIHDQVGLWGLPALETGVNWSLVDGLGRPNIEIYNMPVAMLTQAPPLFPPPGRSIPLYTFISDVKSPPNFYPLTADKQPVALMSRTNPEDAYFSRGICGIEPETLTYQSHKDLTRFVLVRHFRAGDPTAP